MSRLSFLDGLRGWGAVAVLLYHTFVGDHPMPGSTSAAIYHAPLFNGPLAVMVFFIVSGFSLSIGYIEQHNRLRLERLAIGRYFRLVIPILFFVGLTFLANSIGMFDDNTMRGRMIGPAVSSPWEALRFSLFDVFFDNHPKHSPIPPLWTMPIELVGSMIVLATLWLSGDRKWRWGCYAAIIVAMFAIHHSRQAGQYSAFIAGVIYAEAYQFLKTRRLLDARPQWPLLLAMIGFACAIYQADQGPYLSLFTGMTIFAGFAFSNPGTRLMTTGVSQFLGRISFTLYLVHVLVLAVGDAVLYRMAPERGSAEDLIAKVLLAALAILIASGLSFIDRLATSTSRWVAIKLRPVATSYQGAAAE